MNKKPVQRETFKNNEYVVYPAHGVGQVVGIEEQEIAGLKLELYVISFEKDKMILRVPTASGRVVCVFDSVFRGAAPAAEPRAKKGKSGSP